MKISQELNKIWKRRIGIAFTAISLLFLITVFISAKDNCDNTQLPKSSCIVDLEHSLIKNK